jgi:flagellar basal body-associated protein FliL
MKRTKIVAFIIITVTFLLGVAAGYSVSSIMADAEARKERESPYGNVSEYVKERLNLHEAQVVIYDGLIEKRHEKMSELHAQFRKQFRSQTDSLRDEIRSILTEEQRDEYEKFLEEYTAYRKAQRKSKDE